MCARKLHGEEIDIDAALVGELVRVQFPEWAGLPVQEIESSGTDNAIYRLGECMSVRLPRYQAAAEQVEKDCMWLPKLAPHLPLAVPVPLAKGEPSDRYPWHWYICQWIAGENASVACLADLSEAAGDLAKFVAALRRIDTDGAPLPGRHNFFRGVPLAMRDSKTRECISAVGDLVAVDAVTAAWEAALRCPPWAGEPAWIHGDLLETNVLVEHGRVNAVIDFGGLAVGDPACDLMIAWTLFSGESREVFRKKLSVDDASWERGRGWALSWALVALPYYLDTNPVIVEQARRAIDAVLADSL